MCKYLTSILDPKYIRCVYRNDPQSREKYLYPELGRHNSRSDKFMKSLTAVLEFAVRFMRGMHVRNCNEAPALKCNFFSNSIMKARASFDLIYDGIICQLCYDSRWKIDSEWQGLKWKVIISFSHCYRYTLLNTDCTSTLQGSKTYLFRLTSGMHCWTLSISKHSLQGSKMHN